MDKIKTIVNSKNQHDNEVYYDGLIIRYNPDNTVIRVVKASSRQQLIEGVLQMISRLVDVQVGSIEGEYRQEIDIYWEEQGEYLVQCTNYDMLSGVVILIEMLCNS